MSLYEYLVRKFSGLPEESDEVVAAKNYKPPLNPTIDLKPEFDLHEGIKLTKVDKLDSNELEKEVSKIYDKRLSR